MSLIILLIKNKNLINVEIDRSGMACLEACKSLFYKGNKQIISLLISKEVNWIYIFMFPNKQIAFYHFRQNCVFSPRPKRTC